MKIRQDSSFGRHLSLALVLLALAALGSGCISVHGHTDATEADPDAPRYAMLNHF